MSAAEWSPVGRRIVAVRSLTKANAAKQGWDEVPSRLSIGMDAVLGALDRHGARATFFFLGWIA